MTKVKAARMAPTTPEQAVAVAAVSSTPEQAVAVAAAVPGVSAKDALKRKRELKSVPDDAVAAPHPKSAPRQQTIHCQNILLTDHGELYAIIQVIMCFRNVVFVQKI
jgi:hypothetical protein